MVIPNFNVTHPTGVNMNRKTIKINDKEFLIGVPYTFFKLFAPEFKNIVTEDGHEASIRISPYEQWNAFMMRKVNEGNRIIQNVTVTKISGDDPNSTIAIKFEVIYTE